MPPNSPSPDSFIVSPEETPLGIFTEISLFSRVAPLPEQLEHFSLTVFPEPEQSEHIPDCAN